MASQISIIMPCYNGMKYIQQAVDSVFMQSIEDWELLISDDGSSDGTREYLSSLSDKRIKVFLQEKNLGIFGNINFLFSQASCEISQILCQDDYFINQDSLSFLIEKWRQLSPDIAYIRTSHGLDSTSGLAQYETEVLPNLVTPEGSSLYFYIFGNVPGNLSNISLRTSIVAQHGWFRLDLPYAGDFEFWSRVGQTSPWMIFNHHVVLVRNHSEQASFTLNQKGELIVQLNYVIERLYRQLAEQGFSPLSLKLMATVNYISQHRDAGFKKLLIKNDSQYLKLVQTYFDQSTFGLGVFAGWLVYIVSLGGRLFRITLVKALFTNKLVALRKGNDR